LRILIFNWRDIKNPDAGGAEVFTHQIAKRWVEWKHQVTLFTAEFPGGSTEEVVDGVHVVRRGGRYSVYWRAKGFYRSLPRGSFDVVIDEINTRPFFASEFVSDAKVVALIHQLAREFWNYEMTFPLGYVGRYLLEPRWLRKYARIPTVTVSESTRHDVLSLGFKEVYIVRNGANIAPMAQVPRKADVPTLVFVGRVRKAKLPEHALIAFSEVHRQIPDMRLWFMGDGYLRPALEKRWGNDDGVRFLGRVPETEKLRLLSEAHAVLVPGVREGWGQVVIEANACGTPAIGYNIPGIRDSIRHEVTGLLTKDKSPKSLSEQIARLLGNKELQRSLSENALAWSREFSWDKSAADFMGVLENAVVRHD